MKPYPLNEDTIRRSGLETLKALLKLIDAPKHRAAFEGSGAGGPVVHLLRRGWIQPAGHLTGASAQGGRKYIWDLKVEISPKLIALIRDITDTP